MPQNFLAGLVHRQSAPVSIPEDPLLSPKQNFHIKYWALLVFAVLAAFGPLVLINQPFWDDWVLFAHYEAGSLWELFKQLGRREQFILMEPFAALGEPRACIMAVLLLNCLMGPLIYTIIRRTTQWAGADAFWAALLTALAPLNQARFVLSTVPYAFSCFFFTLSIVLLLRDLQASSVGRRISIVLLLVLAFSTNSFLVLSWIPPAIVAIAASRKAKTSASLGLRAGAIARSVIGRSEIVVLPLIYWLAKKLLEPTYGPYADYNKFRMGVFSALRQTAATLLDQFRDAYNILIPARSDLAELCIATAAVVVLFNLAARIWRLPLRTTDDPSDDSRWVWHSLTLALVLALILSALFPYVIVGQPPRFSGLWETRHQTTLALVSGFAIFACLRMILRPPLRHAAAALIAAGFLLLDISFTQRLVADALEARAIFNTFKQQPSQPGTMMLVVENDREYRAFGRFFAFYELSYLVNASRSGGPVLPISNREVLDPATGQYAKAPVPAVISALVGICEKFRSKPPYGFANFVSNGRIETVKLLANQRPPGLFQTMAEAIRATVAEPPGMVRIESEITTIPDAHTSPCCSNP